MYCGGWKIEVSRVVAVVMLRVVAIELQLPEPRGVTRPISTLLLFFFDTSLEKLPAEC